MIKRRILWIQPEFQKRMMLFWVLQAFAVTVITYLITIGWTVFSTNPTLAGYIRVFVRPALLVSAGVGFVISCLAGLYYSHRIAGPIYRIKKTIDEVLDGKAPGTIVLRRHDELKDLAAHVSKLIQYFQKSPKK